MKTDIFTDFDKRMGIIPRWTIVHTIQKQSVAEHCFNVERIATRIAREWFSITEKEYLFEISQWALHHDDLEAVTGDIQSPVKPLFDEEGAEELYPEICLGQYRPLNPMYVRLVKLADIMEWIVFALYEQALGNTFIDDFVDYHCKAVDKFAYIHFSTPISNQVKEWIFVMRKNPIKLRDFGRRM